MADQTVTLRIQANADGTIRAVRQVNAALDEMGAEGTAGGTAAARGLRQVETQSRRASSALDGLVSGVKGFATAFVSFQGVSALTRIADEYTNLTSKIRLVTDSELELKAVRESVFQVAQQTRQDLTATGDLYTRLARSTADMGLSQQKLLGITTTINQAFVVSGASAQEAAAAITQLSQGLASGVLRGDEFNSVAEQAPVIMDLLAKQLGVTRGELRKMAEDGELTADVLVNALGNGAEGVAEQFGKMQLTIGQATTQLRNAFTEFVGSTDEANGASRAFAEAISTLARNLPTVINAAYALGTAVAAIYGAQVLARAAAFTVQIGLQTAAHVASTAALVSQQGVWVTLFATQSAGFAASIRNIGVLNAAFGALGAAVAGWQIGTYLREEFLEVRLLGIAMVQGIVNAFERGEQLILTSWEAMKAGANLYFESVRRSAADIVGFLADSAEFTDVFGINEEAVASLRKMEASLRPTTNAAIGFVTAVVRINAETEKQIALNDQVFSDMADYEIAAEASKGATEGLSDAVGDLADGLPKVGEEAAKAAERMKKALAEMRREGEQIFEVNKRNEEALLNFTAGLEEEIKQIGLSEEARRRNNVMLELEALLKAAGTDPAYADRLREETLALLARGEAAQAAADQDEALRRSAEQAASDYQRSWMQAADGVSYAIGDFVTGSISSFNDLSRQVRDIFKRMLADMIAQWVRSGVTRIFASLFGAGNSTAAFAGNGGGAGGVLQMFGGGSGGAGGMGGFANALPALAAVAGGLYGFSNRGGSNGSAGSVLGGAAYGAAGWAAGSAALGAASFGGAAAAATGGGVAATLGGAASGAASGAAGAFGAGSVIPVVGWVLAIAALVDAVAGGKLFGTRFRPENATSSLSVGEGGGTASTSITEVRNRSLFRGRQWRESQVDPGDEAREAATGLFEQIRDIMTQSARQLQIDVPPIIEGAIRTVSEFDKKGKVTSTKVFVDVLGRTWEEATAELAATRLSAEAIIKTVDAAIGTTVQVAAANIGNSIGSEFGGISDRIRDQFDAIDWGGIGGALTPATQTMSEASAIAERWRGDAELLLEGAQFLLAASVDIRNGIDLLDGGSLTELTDLVEELATGNETLSQTYARLRAATQLLEQALDLSGVELEVAGEAFVRFAADIVDAAGGLERASALWTGYFNRFYSEAERAQALLDQVRSGATTQFTDIGLDAGDFTGEGGTARFRELFESALPTLGAEAVVEWLEAAEALGLVIDAQAALNNALGGTGQQLAEFMASIEQGLAELDMSALEIELRRIRSTMLEQIETATALGAGERELGLIREFAMRQASRAIEAEVEVLRDAFEQLAGSIADLRGRVSDDIAGLRASAPGFDAVGDAQGRINALRARLAAGGNPEQQIELIDQIRQATLDRFGAEQDGIRAAAAAQEELARAEQQRADEVQRAAQQSHAEAMRNWEAQQQAAARLRDYVDNLGLSNVSPLTAFQRFDESQALYQRALAGGDAAALQQAAQAYLEETRNVYGVSEQAVGIFNQVRGALGTRADQLASVAMPAFSAPALERAIGGTSAAVVDVSAGVEALRAQAIAELEALDLLLSGLNEQAAAQFDAEAEALRGQIAILEENHDEVIAVIRTIDSGQADRDAAVLDQLRAQTAAAERAAAAAEAQSQNVVTLVAVNEQRFVAVLNEQRVENERLVRSFDQAVRSVVRA